MWCNKCHSGNPYLAMETCGVCRSTDVTDKDPFEKARQKPRSIRAMWKRKDYKAPTKKQEDVNSEEIADVTKGNLRGRDYTQFQ